MPNGILADVTYDRRSDNKNTTGDTWQTGAYKKSEENARESYKGRIESTIYRVRGPGDPADI